MENKWEVRLRALEYYHKNRERILERLKIKREKEKK